MRDLGGHFLFGFRPPPQRERPEPVLVRRHWWDEHEAALQLMAHVLPGPACPGAGFGAMDEPVSRLRSNGLRRRSGLVPVAPPVPCGMAGHMVHKSQHGLEYHNGIEYRWNVAKRCHEAL